MSGKEMRKVGVIDDKFSQSWFSLKIGSHFYENIEEKVTFYHERSLLTVLRSGYFKILGNSVDRRMEKLIKYLMSLTFFIKISPN